MEQLIGPTMFPGQGFNAPMSNLLVLMLLMGILKMVKFFGWGLLVERFATPTELLRYFKIYLDAT